MLITLLPYYYGSMATSLNAYYLITLLLWWYSCVYISLNAYYLITMVVWLCVYLFRCLLPNNY